MDDFLGKKFNRLTVIEEFPYRVNKKIVYKCLCDCGNYVNVVKQSLKNGNTKSCGCLQKEKISQMFSKHNHSSEKLYKVWKAMRKRCENPNDKSYKYYGAKGVKVCEEWQTYQPFREWAYQNGYIESKTYNYKTIDRINPFENYCPSNCRIVDWVVQRHNRRENYGKNL